jgi:O-antigen/teichoic acid export membrane protein
MGVPRDPRQQNPEASNLSGRVATGSAWMIGMRWTVRVIGLVSTVVLARILTPEDFGLVAMAMLIVGFLEVFTETGMAMALIRHPDPSRDHFDTVWTVRLLISLLMVCLLLAVAPLGALYFKEPRAEILIQVLSLKALLGGLENVGIVWFRRNMDFAREYRFFVYRKVVPFVVTLICAFWLRNYWALVVGIIAGQATGTLLSYTMHPHRPRWCLNHLSELWSFSIWVLVSYIGGYLQSRVDQLVVGGVASAQQLGHYSVASELGQTPLAEVLEPMGRVLYPAYSKLHLEPERYRDAYLSALSAIAIIAAPGAAGLAVIAHDLMPVVFGPQWADASPLLVWLALGAGVFGISNSVTDPILAAGFAARNAFQTWTRFLVLSLSLGVASMVTDVEGLAAVSMCVSLVLAPTYFYQLKQVLPMKWSDIAAALWRPISAAAIMAVVLLGLGTVLGDLLPVVRLLILVVTGMITFGSSLLVLWHLAGRRQGVEAMATAFVLARLSRWRKQGAP